MLRSFTKNKENIHNHLVNFQTSSFFAGQARFDGLNSNCSKNLRDEAQIKEKRFVLPLVPSALGLKSKKSFSPPSPAQS